ncbi:DUF4231 domain-containing protein [Kitasatospora sp. MMS16-BH015]|uniref:DUF4231 domain-containing protein n=1 Tax=Kitasatospora sp. MMS16-BH015 TaxID=2018025 RepID=UPI000CF25B74|nr:DUF4231 domain-containing protein [Kitasatospora sp. MMS16-BH015]
MTAGAPRSMGRVREDDLLPELFWTADSSSLQGQRRAVSLSRWELLMLVAAAATGSADGPVWAWLAALAYGATVALAALAGRQNPQGLWYEGRAAAESVKTLSWKYAVRADAYQPPPKTLPDAERLYDVQLGGIISQFGTTRAIPQIARVQAELDLWRGPLAGRPPRHPQITETMKQLREQPLAVRREVYLRERVLAQRDWYREKARRCANASRRASTLGVVLPLAGLVLAVLRALGWYSYDALGTLSAVAASVAAWAQLRQYRPQAAAYSLAASELTLVEAQLGQLAVDSAQAEETWARLARDAEDAISREHTTWQARREVRNLDVAG